MKPYIQTSEFTTAACGLLMIVNHFKRSFSLSKENEHRIWMASACLPVRASSIYGLAVFAKKQGLRPRIVVGEREYEFPDYRFHRYTKKHIDEAKFTSKLYARDAKELGIPIEERVFDFAEVKSLLEEGRILLLRVNAGILRDAKSTSNYVVVCKDERGMVVMDPRQGRVIVDEALLLEAFETLQTKKKRDPRMIVF
ncbi:hypothetical protein D6783_04015 [Candidatus Woesearchaeota archaeon]|nr:MAG: hypothetical protein D6783_04015 [Candidatus Woesearchaeota archaeon]